MSSRVPAGDGELRFRTRPNIRWVWLIYLAFFVMGPMMYGSTEAVWWAVAGVAVFLPIYWVAGRVSGARLVWPILGMVALGCSFAWRNPGASVFFVYAAAECGRLGSRRRAIAALLLVGAVVIVISLLTQPAAFFWMPALTLVLVIGTVGIHEQELERKNRQIAQSRQEVERLARIAERERIARDLHDLLGHTLSVVILKSELARKLAARDPERAAAEIGEVEDVARRALDQVRSAVAAYRSESLLGELENARQVLASAQVALDLRADDVELPPLVEGSLALIVREAVTNVIRHAAAAKCGITLRADGDRVRLVIEDDGRGFRPPEGTGLRGMRERLAALGGSLDIEGGRGTRLAIEVPTTHWLAEAGG